MILEVSEFTFYCVVGICIASCAFLFSSKLSVPQKCNGMVKLRCSWYILEVVFNRERKILEWSNDRFVYRSGCINRKVIWIWNRDISIKEGILPRGKDFTVKRKGYWTDVCV